MSWKPEWGPASILAIVQLGAICIGGVYTYASLQNTATNTKETTAILTGIVERQVVKTSDLNDRLIKVETNLTAQSQTLMRIDQKLDVINTKPHTP